MQLTSVEKVERLFSHSAQVCNDGLQRANDAKNNVREGIPALDIGSFFFCNLKLAIIGGIGDAGTHVLEDNGNCIKRRRVVRVDAPSFCLGND